MHLSNRRRRDIAARDERADDVSLSRKDGRASVHRRPDDEARRRRRRRCLRHLYQSKSEESLRLELLDRPPGPISPRKANSGGEKKKMASLESRRAESPGATRLPVRRERSSTSPWDRNIKILKYYIRYNIKILRRVARSVEARSRSRPAGGGGAGDPAAREHREHSKMH